MERFAKNSEITYVLYLFSYLSRNQILLIKDKFLCEWFASSEITPTFINQVHP